MELYIFRTPNKMLSTNEIKHPLQNEWGFWLFKNTEKDWKENLAELTSFNTVEDYWCLYHHMKLPSELKQGQDYAIFKKGIRPMWEDSANESGGRWQIMFERLRGNTMNSIWLDAVLLLIGDNFKYSDSICGVVVNVRPRNKISVWMNCKDPEPVMDAGKTLRKHLPVPNKINFYSHNNTSSALYSS